MNPRQYRTTCPLAGLWLVLSLIPGICRAEEETFALVETKTGVYSNVTVTTKAKDYIVIQHAGGLTSLKVAELSPAYHQALGYGPAKGSSKGSFMITARAKSLVAALPTKGLEQAWSKHAPAGITSLKLNSTIVFGALGVFGLLYLFFCYCGALICRKAGKPSGWMMWLPVLQYIPLLRAAKMSPLWLLALGIPLLNLWAHVMWSFRIAGACGRGFGTALLLILPTYPLAFAYLALAKDKVASEETVPPQKFRTTGLVFDQS